MADGDVEPRYAGFWVRLAAELIDEVIVIAFILLSLLVLSLPSYLNLPTAVALIINLVILALIVLVIVAVFGYPVYFVATTGSTIGKGILGLVVVDKDGRYPVGWWKAFLREIIGKHIINRLTLYLGFLLIAFDPKKQGLHDKLAGTYVVHKDSLAKSAQDIRSPPASVEKVGPAKQKAP